MPTELRLRAAAGHAMNVKRTPRRTLASAASLLAVAALAIGSSATASGSVAPASRANAPVAATSVVASVVDAAKVQSARPNFVFITTDDQRVDDMRWMPFTRRLIGARGINFTRALPASVVLPRSRRARHRSVRPEQRRPPQRRRPRRLPVPGGAPQHAGEVAARLRVPDRDGREVPERIRPRRGWSGDQGPVLGSVEPVGRRRVLLQRDHVLQQREPDRGNPDG